MVNFTAFLSYIFISAFTPGPNNIMAMANAGRFGFKKSLRFCVGVFIGMLFVVSCCMALCALLYGLIPVIEPVMVYVGAGYILWLAWSVYRSNSQNEHDDEESGEKNDMMKANSILTGAVLQFLNVKLYLYGITTASTFILPYYKSVPALTVFVLIMSLMGFLGTACWALFGSVFERFFREHGKAMNTIMALLLVYCAVTLIIK